MGSKRVGLQLKTKHTHVLLHLDTTPPIRLVR